ncbi:MAG: hypothetical protein K2M27_01535 [Muribaculaceae bacterium]|nr:hypothetical protein [Muribaculaceae bacterium]
MKHFLKRGLPLLVLVSMQSCIDNGYDLDNIDTTSEFKVKDLVLPINLDVITLGDIIEIKEGDQIKEISLNGQKIYAVQEKGTFHSDPISIPAFSSDAPSVSPSTLTFNNPLSRSTSTGNASSLTFPLNQPIHRNVTYQANDIDRSIIEISDIYVSGYNVTINFYSEQAISTLADIELSDIRIQLPKGLDIECITPAGIYNDNGILTIPSLKFENGTASLSVNAKAINLPANNAYIDSDNRSLSLSADINIESANLTVTPKNTGTSMPSSSVNISVSYSLSPLSAEAVSGKIRYLLEGDALNISPISLNDLPDFLAQEGTDLILNNPQIYLSVNNPVANDNIGYQTGLILTAVRENESNRTFSLDNGNFRVGYNLGNDGPYNFCLSPEMPSSVPSSFTGATHVPFTSLGNVISGNGLPKMIDIKLDNPQIYEQTVEKFALGRELGTLSGNWEFLAPLALKSGTASKIVYTETKDGWNDEYVDAITISSLEISLDASSTLPLKAHISGFPIDKNGQPIAGVTIEGADIEANTSGQPVTIRVTGEVRHLDGISFTATVLPGDNDETLSPDQTLTLDKIRVKVSGNYTKEL